MPACIFYKVDNKNHEKIIDKFLWENKDHIREIDHINKNLIFEWNYVKEFEEKTKFSQCEKCIYINSCQWVWKSYPWLFWKEEFIPINF